MPLHDPTSSRLPVAWSEFRAGLPGGHETRRTDSLRKMTVAIEPAPHRLTLRAASELIAVVS